MAEEKIEKTTPAAKAKEQIEFQTLLAEKDVPSWKMGAFVQFSGWKPGKTVTREEFDAKWKEFHKKYGGKA